MYSMGLTDSDRAILDEQERDARYDGDPLSHPACTFCDDTGLAYDDEYGYSPCTHCEAGAAIDADEAIPLPMLSDDEDDFADVPFD